MDERQGEPRSREHPTSAAAILWIIALGAVAAVVTHRMAVVLPVAVAAMITAALVLPRARP